MNILKRAFLYVSRKWQQSLILFFVLLVVCASAFIGLSILKASSLAAANLRGQLGGTFSMEIDTGNAAHVQSAASTEGYTASYYAGKFLDHTVIDEVMKTSGISEYSANTEVVANLKSDKGQYHSLVENPQNYYSSSNSHIAMIQGWTSLHQCAYFANQTLEVTQGGMFTDDGTAQAVISRELAERNQIEIGDMLILEINHEVIDFLDFPLERQECVFEIVGIFDICAEQQTDQYTSQRQMLQNWVFVDARTLLPYLNGLLESIGQPPMGYEKVTFRVKDPAEMDSIIKNIQENKAIDWDYFKIMIDNTNYKSAENALKGMDGGIRMTIIAITAAGIGILILLLSIWTKSRIHETGILLSVGKSKWEILTQRMAEMMLITVLALGMAYVCGNIAANEVGNRLLSQTNEQNTEESTANSLHSGLPVQADSYSLTPVFSAPKVEELTVNISADIVVMVYAMELLIALASIGIACIPVMGIKPKMILTKYE